MINTKSISPVNNFISNPFKNNQTEKVTNDFSQILKNAISDLNNLDKEASNKINELLTGKLENVHDVMIAMEKSKIGLNLALEIRNKLIESYKEVMRMQI